MRMKQLIAQTGLGGFRPCLGYVVLLGIVAVMLLPQSVAALTCGCRHPVTGEVPRNLTPCPIGDGLECGGVLVTCRGTNGRDNIFTSRGADVIHSLGGRDEIDYAPRFTAGEVAGPKIVCAGDGRDEVKLRRYPGATVIYGGPGHDELRGSRTGSNMIFGEGGRDLIAGGNRDDELDGGDGHDALNGLDGDDIIHGGAGIDRLDGGRGHDQLDGGPGQDLLDGARGDDQLDGGPGRDVLRGGRGSDRINVGSGDRCQDPDGDCEAEPEPEPKRIFITSALFSGDLGGLNGADAKCQAAASDAGLSGTFKAWLSTKSVDAKDRLTQASVPYALPNGTKVADHFDDLIDGSLDAPIDVTETGSSVSDERGVWTATAEDGTYNNMCEFQFPPDVEVTCDCASWTKPAPECDLEPPGPECLDAFFASGGEPFSDESWTNSPQFPFVDCNVDNLFALYCLEQ